MNETKKQLTENPGPEDVHEQREHEQPRQGVVEAPENEKEKSTHAKPDGTREPTPPER